MIKLQVGKTYLDRQCAEIKIVEYNCGLDLPFVGLNADGGRATFREDGKFFFECGESPYDLVAERRPYDVSSRPEAPVAPQHPAPSAVNVWTLLRDHWRKYGRTLPQDSAARKEIPIESGFNKYFPAAIVCIAAWSKFNNNKHNPDEPLHHSRGKSSDHEDCIARHNIDIADAVLSEDELVELEEATAVAWRACARVQLIAERLGAPPAPAARFPEVAK